MSKHLSPKRGSKSSLPIIIIIVAAVLVLTAAALLCVKLFGGEKNAPVAATPQETSETAPTPSPMPELPAVKDVRISEVMAKNHAVLRDADGDFSDWFELANRSGAPLSLSGWSVSDGGFEWALPDVTLGDGEYLLVFASGKDRSDGELHASFELSAKDTLELIDDYGRTVDSAVLMGSESNLSLIKTEDGSYAISDYPTPGRENSHEQYARLQAESAAPSPLAIYEVMTSNSAYLQQGTEFYDLVELKNVSDSPVELSDYYLSDDKSDYKLWQMPETTLAPGETVTVFCAGNKEVPARSKGIFAPFVLDGDNAELYLCSEDKLIDFAPLHNLTYNGSFGRMDGENGFFYFETPTPKADNVGGVRCVAEKPAVSAPDGVYNDADSVKVELTASGTVHYTLDGSAPDEESPAYASPIVLDKTTVVRAVNVDEGEIMSRPLTLSYIINENHTLPVASLVSDDVFKFNELYRRAYKTAYMPGCISFYEDGGSFTYGCGIRMSGKTSLLLPKKSFNLKFSGAYGDGELDYPVFGDGISEFSKITVRGGSDASKCIIKNELCENLAMEFSDNILTQRSRYCVLYINGEYRGIYCFKDKLNERYCAETMGVSPESTEVFSIPFTNNTDFYNNVFLFCKGNDMSKTENYEKLCSMVDVDSVVDWMVLEGYTGNWDLLYGNVGFCRSSENGGKWKMIYFDLDCAFRQEYLVYRNILDVDYGINPAAQLIRQLLKNEEFKDKFLRRTAEALSTTLSDEHVLEMINSLYGELEDEVARDCERWEREFDDLRESQETLRGRFAGEYRTLCIDNLCTYFGLTDEQREDYFGKE